MHVFPDHPGAVGICFAQKDYIGTDHVAIIPQRLSVTSLVLKSATFPLTTLTLWEHNFDHIIN